MARAPQLPARGMSRRALAPRRVATLPKVPAVTFTPPATEAADLLRRLASRAHGAVTWHADGSVTLTALDGGARWRAHYASPEQAVAAFEADRVKWLALPLPEHLANLTRGVQRSFESMRNNY